MQNPFDPDATYAVRNQGRQPKSPVGYKAQVAETGVEATLEKGEPTQNFLTTLVIQPAHHADESGARKVEEVQGQLGGEPPSVHYVDGAYLSAQRLVEAAAAGQELIGPVQSAPSRTRSVSRWKRSGSRWSNGGPCVRPAGPTIKAVGWKASKAGSSSASNGTPRPADRASCARPVWARISGSEAWGSANITASCKPGAKSSRPSFSKGGCASATPLRALRANWSGSTDCAARATGD